MVAGSHKHNKEPDRHGTRHHQMNGPPLQLNKVKGTPGLMADGLTMAAYGGGGQSHRDSVQALCICGC